MTGLIEHIRSNVGEDAIESDMCEAKQSSCTIDLKPLKENNTPHLAIDIDKAVIANKSLIDKKRKRCDFLIIVDKGDFYLVLPVEVKTRTVKVSHVKEQIKGGLEIFERLKKGFIGKSTQCLYLPYYLSAANNPYINQSQNNNSIKFRGKKLAPIFVRCGRAFFANVEERLEKMSKNA